MGCQGVKLSGKLNQCEKMCQAEVTIMTMMNATGSRNFKQLI